MSVPQGPLTMGYLSLSYLPSLESLQTPLRAMRHFAKIIQHVLDDLLPGYCALCGGKSHDALCAACCNQYIDWRAPRCLSCSIRLLAEHRYQRCGACLSHPPAFDASFAATDYAAPIDRLLQNLKFHAKLSLAQAFGKILSDMPSPPLTADLLIAVPLSQERLAQRGFNQSLEIARFLEQRWKLPLANNICLRIKNTQTQSSLPLNQRRVNIRNAFALQNSSAIKGKQIVLVDDVMTTGHTLNELAHCLKRHGALRVINLVVARTPIR